MSEHSLNIVYEDEFLLVVDKPAGLLMHPSWLDKHETDTLASRVKHYLGGAKVHTVHRLDRPTSGLVVIGKQDSIARALAEQFAGRTVEKTYWAIVRGFTPESLIIDHPITEELDKIADRDASQLRQPQPAVTHFQRLGISELALPVSHYSKARYSWLQCSPKTGRKHQIRKHLKHIRHPIVSDSRYGCRHNNKLAAQSLGIHSLALRAISLSFQHPMTHQTLNCKLSLNDEWAEWLMRLGWSLDQSIVVPKHLVIGKTIGQ